MTEIGVDTTLNERWNEGYPECGLDFCAECGCCLGCHVINPVLCPSEESILDHHIWCNSEGEVKLV